MVGSKTLCAKRRISGGDVGEQLCQHEVMVIRNDVTDAYEIVVGETSPEPVLITCEHASNRLPEPWNWSAADERLRGMHWAYDIGAAEITRAVTEELRGVGVLSRFSRLLIDANRDLDMDNVFREMADGRAVDLNTGLTDQEKNRRIETYWRPFHDKLDQVCEELKPKFLLSIHSYTPLYEGNPRAVEMGVLHNDKWPDLAQKWNDFLAAESGMDVRINEPYTGIGGFMYSAHVHAERANCHTIEMEIRQDIAGDPAQRPRIVALLKDAVLHSLADWCA